MPSVTSVAYWAPKGWNELKVIVSCTFRDVQTAALFLSSAFRVPWEAEATFVTTPIDGCYITTHTHSHLWSGSELVNRSASLQARLLLCNKQTLCYFVKQTIHLCLPCKATYVRPYLRRWFENAKKTSRWFRVGWSRFGNGLLHFLWLLPYHGTLYTVTMNICPVQWCTDPFALWSDSVCARFGYKQPPAYFNIISLANNTFFQLFSFPFF